jgi:hypothetical protein
VLGGAGEVDGGVRGGLGGVGCAVAGGRSGVVFLAHRWSKVSGRSSARVQRIMEGNEVGVGFKWVDSEDCGLGSLRHGKPVTFPEWRKTTRSDHRKTSACRVRR